MDLIKIIIVVFAFSLTSFIFPNSLFWLLGLSVMGVMGWYLTRNIEKLLHISWVYLTSLFILAIVFAFGGIKSVSLYEPFFFFNAIFYLACLVFVIILKGSTNSFVFRRKLETVSAIEKAEQINQNASIKVEKVKEFSNGLEGTVQLYTSTKSVGVQNFSVDREQIGMELSRQLDVKFDMILSQMNAISERIKDQEGKFENVQQALINNNYKKTFTEAISPLMEEIQGLANQVQKGEDGEVLQSVNKILEQQKQVLEKKIQELETIKNEEQSVGKVIGDFMQPFIQEINLLKNDIAINVQQGKATDGVIRELLEKCEAGEVDFTNTAHLRNEQIREVFIQGIKSAKIELLIVSPWIGKWVLDKDFVNLIEEAFIRGVSLKILYGIKDNYKNQKNSTNSTESIANELRRRFSIYINNGQFKMEQGNTHYKLFICDETFYIAGSYNFLSFKGEYDRNTRDEGVQYSENKVQIRELKGLYFNF